VLLELLKPVIDPLRSWVADRRRVRLRVHRAVFGNDRECYFINATNLSRSREVEITHVWFDSLPQIAALESDRPLPKRLKPDETWETWVDVERVPPDLRATAYTLARARLSTGAVIKSRKNERVPHQGTVPGGPITQL
jgi:hypothetical protein